MRRGLLHKKAEFEPCAARDCEVCGDCDGTDRGPFVLELGILQCGCADYVPKSTVAHLCQMDPCLGCCTCDAYSAWLCGM